MTVPRFHLANFAPDSNGDIHLFVEAIRPSTSVGSDTITVSRSGSCSGTAKVVVTAAEIEAHDLRHWGPTLNPGPALTDNDLWGIHFLSTVSGAITDGTSICLIRVTPKFATGLPVDWNAPPPQQHYWGLQISKRGNSSAFGNPDSKIFGTVEQTHQPFPPDTMHLPHLPYIESGSQQPGSSSAFYSGLALYVPPSSYVDQLSATTADFLSNGETTPMELQVHLDFKIVGRAAFLLRRPPLVLVHGILSGPETWNPSEYVEGPGRSPVPTRIYKVDYSLTSSKGYGENFAKLAKTINDALQQYRFGQDSPYSEHVNLFHGVRYAATRVDVVAHSQGGQLARLYASNLNQPVIRGGAWDDEDTFDATRPELPPTIPWQPNGTTGHWKYLRADNWGAGDIRRLITLGSPFEGSPLASTAASVLEPTEENKVKLLLWTSVNPGDGGMPDALDALLFDGANYKAPTCVADLMPGSAAQLLLDDPTRYPLQPAPVRWYPMVGIAADGSLPAAGLSLALTQFLDSPFSLPLLGYLFSIQDVTDHLVLDPDYPQVGLNTSDMVVPEASQRDNVDLPWGYLWHTHSAVPPTVTIAGITINLSGINGETASSVMAGHVGAILSSPLEGFSLPAVPDYFPIPATNLHMFKLGPNP